MVIGDWYVAMLRAIGNWSNIMQYRSIVLMAYLQILDVLTTAIFMRLGLHEGNVLMKPLVGFGLWAPALLKLSVVAFIAWAWSLVKTQHRARIGRWISGINVLYAGVVFWNLFIIYMRLR